MKLQDLTIKEFLARTASNEALPAGGCSTALIAAISAALTEMFANLTIGRKKYAKVEERMKKIALIMSENRAYFLNSIDRDADAYQLLLDAYTLPKNSAEEISIRNEKIQEASKIASLVPMELAERAHNMLEILNETIKSGNINAVTDAKVGLLACQTAIKSSLLNVRANLENISDKDFVNELTAKCDELEKEKS